MKALVYFCLALVLIFANLAFTEVYWDKTFGGISYDLGLSVQQTTDGGYIITGYTGSYGGGGSDVWFLKTDNLGNLQWDRTFGRKNDERSYSIQQCSDGGYIITGVTWTSETDSDILLIKIGSLGFVQWYKTFGGTSNDQGYSIWQCSDGGYIITGYTSSYGAGGADVWLIKTNASGVIQWDKTFGDANDDYGNSVQQTTDGGYIITGYTGSYGAGGAEVWLIRTDASGNTQWDKTFGGTNDDYGESVQQTTDGGFIITGSYGAGQGEVWLIKTDNSGNTQWDKTFGGSSNDYGESVQQTTDGGYIITGYTESYGAGLKDVWLIKTDNSGNKQWDKTFGGTSSDGGYSVQQTTDGGYIITGYFTSYGAADVWLIYYNPENSEANISDLNLMSVFLIILSLSSFLFLKRKRV